jgi:GH25 family lysozyme M1 (1,4-beta-N-acetylmuramidase)
MTVNGIDISHWQDPTPALSGLAFAFARASIGVMPDHMYPEHEAHFRAAGIVRGAYHFGVGGVNVIAQADTFLTAAKGAELLALDLEHNASGETMTQDEARAFIAHVRQSGRHIGLYHSASGFPELGQEWDWVAQWGETPPTRHWAFWQKRGAPLDLDVFNGTLAGLRLFAGRPKPAPKPKPVVKAYHTVVHGDNLSAIAKSHGKSLAALLKFPENAKYRANPSLIHAGDKVRVR